MMSADAGSHAGVFEAAAAVLARQAGGEIVRQAAGAPVGETVAADDLLRRLGYDDGDATALPHRVALLRAAAGFRRVFMLQAEEAPGMMALGAEVVPVEAAGWMGSGSVSGMGIDLRSAFESCVGEGVEYLSQFARPADPMVALSYDEAISTADAALQDLCALVRPAGGDVMHWTRAARLSDGAAAWVPADLCYRRAPAERDFAPPWPLSTGCGAGLDLPSATLHGVLELIERDATALWWRGGVRGRLVPAGLGGTMIARLRQGRGGRLTWLLDITSDVGVPVAAALSCNHDGYGLCAGFAAGVTLGGAADAALREMAQMELAYQVSVAKRTAGGEAALNAIDRQHIHRYKCIAIYETPALHPLAPPAIPCDVAVSGTLARLAAVRRRLETVGLACYALDLTRASFGIPVTRVVCPGLDMGLAAPVGARLRAAAARHGADPAASPAL